MVKLIYTVFIHRPERILYYLPEITEDAIPHIADGACPPSLQEYQYTFGTYDRVGIFYLSAELQKQTGMKKVVGIEYRMDAPSLSVPENLPCRTSC